MNFGFKILASSKFISSKAEAFSFYFIKETFLAAFDFNTLQNQKE